jgi:murein DD-endopeptidase MepM/ murein hydrolase activator NlpD
MRTRKSPSSSRPSPKAARLAREPGALGPSFPVGRLSVVRVPHFVQVAALWLDRARPGVVSAKATLRSLEIPEPLARALALSLGVVSLACGLVPRDGGDGRSTPVLSPLDPELAKYKSAKASRATPWAYVLPIDHGVRADKSGEGYFRAPRFHGEHNGIDLLAPVGTPVFAACAGRAMAATSPSFGNSVQVICPVPNELWSGRGSEPWVSFFYAHLKESLLPTGRWIDVSRGAPLGSVGKSGNAGGSEVQPHLHLELIVQRNQRSAMDERHLGTDQSPSLATDTFAERMGETCLDPFGFHPKSRLLTRARRVDPFVALTCLSGQKPDFEKAPEPLGFASTEWSRFYIARRFNVNDGPEAH